MQSALQEITPQKKLTRVGVNTQPEGGLIVTDVTVG